MLFPYLLIWCLITAFEEWIGQKQRAKMKPSLQRICDQPFSLLARFCLKRYVTEMKVKPLCLKRVIFSHALNDCRGHACFELSGPPQAVRAVCLKRTASLHIQSQPPLCLSFFSVRYVCLRSYKAD